MVQSSLQSRVVVMGNEKLRSRMIDELKPVVNKLDEIEDVTKLDANIAEEHKAIFELTQQWE